MVVKKDICSVFLHVLLVVLIFLVSVLIWQTHSCHSADLKAGSRLDRLLSPVSADAEWLAHSEQLCHSSQHPSLPPSHPSVTLHGVQRHHLGLCDRSHVAAGQWQCSLSPQLWPRLPAGLQEHDGQPWRRPPARRRDAVRTDGCLREDRRAVCLLRLCFLPPLYEGLRPPGLIPVPPPSPPPRPCYTRGVTWMRTLGQVYFRTDVRLLLRLSTVSSQILYCSKRLGATRGQRGAKWYFMTKKRRGGKTLCFSGCLQLVFYIFVCFLCVVPYVLINCLIRSIAPPFSKKKKNPRERSREKLIY